MGRLLDEDDVVDWLLKRTEMYDGTGHFVDENVVKKNIESQIAKIPTAHPERKTGKWLTSDDFYETGICSRCKWDSQEPISYAVTNFNFCPNCGARMVQEGEDNDS